MGKNINNFFLTAVTILISTATFAQKTAKQIDDDVYFNNIKATKIVYKTYKEPVKQNDNNTVRDYTQNNGQPTTSEDDNDTYVSYNNYIDNSNDFDYTARLNRFNGHYNFRWRNYYSWGYDPFFDDPYYNGFNRFGFGVGIGFVDPFWGNHLGYGFNRWNFYGSMNPWSPWGGMYSWYNPVYYGNNWSGGWNSGWVGNGGWGNIRPRNNNPRPNVGDRGYDSDMNNRNNSPNYNNDRFNNGRPTRGEVGSPNNSGGRGNVPNTNTRPTRGDVSPTNNQPLNNNGRGNVPSTNTRPTRGDISPNNRPILNDENRSNSPSYNRPTRDDVNKLRDDRNNTSTPNGNSRIYEQPRPTRQQEETSYDKPRVYNTPQPSRTETRPTRQPERTSDDRQRTYDAPRQQPTRTESRPQRQDSGYDRPSNNGGNYGGGNRGGGSYGGGGNGGGGRHGRN